MRAGVIQTSPFGFADGEIAAGGGGHAVAIDPLHRLQDLVSRVQIMAGISHDYGRTSKSMKLRAVRGANLSVTIRPKT